MIKAFEEKQPVVLKVIPIDTTDSTADATIKEMTIVFSKPMDQNGYSINFGERGKEYYPLKEVVGFSSDKTSFTIKADMKPNHEYEFIITNNGFSSEEGYPLLKDYTIKFKTK